MKKQTWISFKGTLQHLLVTLSLLVSTLWVGGIGPTLSLAGQRDRTVKGNAQQRPSPTPDQAATQSGQSRPVKDQTDGENTVPTSGSRLALNATTKTLSELQSRITALLHAPQLASAIAACKVVSLETGRVLFEENANKLLRPASNMKIYTVAAALDRLSPDYRFTTSIYASSEPDSSGVIHGDLIVYGRGDPSISARFNGGDYFKVVDDLATRIYAAGVRRIQGDLIGDETFFTGPPYGSGWTWGDLQWWYGAEVSSLSINDNALDLFIKPGPEAGKAALITTGPPDPLLTINNRVTTGPRGSRRELAIHRGLSADVLEVSGSLPIDDPGYAAAVGISHPALLFVYLLRSSLAKQGIVVSGRSRAIPPSPIADTSSPSLLAHSRPNSDPARIELANRQSPPLSLIAAQTLKPSQNLYTELILRTLGRVAPLSQASKERIYTSEDAGIRVVRDFLNSAGINSQDLMLNDGSGLSRGDLVTADATVQLLSFMSKHKYAQVFRNALPIAGIDGTLKNRLKGTPAANNLRAKTGTLTSGASLSGYVTTAAGENLVFSILINNYPENIDPRSICIDPIAVLLASFAGSP